MNERFLKLTNLVYKVLEFLPEGDPLKSRAKDKALEILENPTAENINMLLGYLQIAKSQGWLNSANCLIISNEYEKLRKLEPKAPAKPVLHKNTEAIVKNTAPSFYISDRQEKILEFLNKNKKAQVMDLEAMLGGVTKRTIRRDMDELLLADKVVRIGEFNQVFYEIKKQRGDGTR